jgi:hypothetical protein
MSNFVVVYDACVLHPPSLRDLLMRLATTDLFRARWTDEIHEEWKRSVLKRFPDIAPAALQRTQERMDAAVPECLVRDYAGMADHVPLPDTADRHVLAAAIKCAAGAIVTYNVKDFPSELLGPLGMAAQHPDEFIMHLLDLNYGAVCAAVKEHRESLKKPPFTVDELLDKYLSHGLAQTVSCLTQFRELL